MRQMTGEPIVRMSARRTSVLGAVLVAIGPITLALYTPAMPALTEVFGTTEAAIKLTLTAYFGGFAAAQLICGPLTDAFGRKPITLAFLALYLVSTVIATYAPDVPSMMIARALQGVGAAVGVTVSRAIVRDQFIGQQSAKIMNAIATMLALGPAVSPTLGGIVLELFGWREIFYCMIVYGSVLLISVALLQPETNAHISLTNIHPGRLTRNYLALLLDPRFMAPSLLLGFCLGNIYAMATVQPFVLIVKVGLSPFEFGMGMLMQSCSFILGNLVTGRLLRSWDADRLLPYALAGILFSSLSMVASLSMFEPSYLSVMIPVGLFAFWLAFILPATLTSAMRDFPHIAGAASALMGFLQFGGGIAGSLAIALLGDPLLGMTTIVPAMPVVGCALYLFFMHRLKKTPSRAEYESNP